MEPGESDLLLRPLPRLAPQPDDEVGGHESPGLPRDIFGAGIDWVEPGGTLRIETDARKWKPRDDWLPGRYGARVRVDRIRADDHCRLSVLSDPFAFETRDVNTASEPEVLRKAPETISPRGRLCSTSQ